MGESNAIRTERGHVLYLSQRHSEIDWFAICDRVNVRESVESHERQIV